MANIKHGQRVSAAAAFLHPVAQRPNLTIAIDSSVTSLVFEGDKVVGVRVGSGRGRGRAPGDSRGRPRPRQHPDAEAAPTLGHRTVRGVAGRGCRRAPRPAERRRSHARASLLRTPVPAPGESRLQPQVEQPARPGDERHPVPGHEEGGPRRALVRHRRLHEDPSRARPGRRADPDGAVDHRTARTREGDRARAPARHAVHRLRAATRQRGHGAHHRADPDAMLEIDSNYFTTEHDRETGVRIFKRMRELFARDPIAAGSSPRPSRARRCRTTTT